MGAGISRKKNPTRVLFLNQRFQSIYGAQANLVRLARLFGSENSIVVSTDVGLFSSECRKQGLECCIVPTPKDLKSFGGKVLGFGILRRLCLIPKFLLMNWRLLWLVRKEKIDVVFAVDWVSFLFFFIASFFSRARVFVYIQGDNTPGLFRLIVGMFASRVLLIADCLKPAFVKSWPPSRKRLRTFYSGFEIPDTIGNAHIRRLFCEEHGIPLSGKIIGLIGSITARKGGDVLIESLPKILKANPESYVVFFGDVPAGYELFANKLNESIDELEVRNHVRFVGFCSQEEMFNTTDVVALPSNSEGLPSVLMESLSYGVPVVATDVAGAKEIVLNANHGQLVPVNDSGSLATAIISVLGDSELLEKRQLRQAYARDNFSVEVYLRRFNHLISEI